MELGLGVLKFPPSHFWAMTVPELLAAIDGYCEANGITNDSPPPKKPFGPSDLKALMDRYPDEAPDGDDA
jgi:uncharacterized phage protein (TIGR02216 family)